MAGDRPRNAMEAADSAARARGVRFFMVSFAMRFTLHGQDLVTKEYGLVRSLMEASTQKPPQTDEFG
jgi:hypothetical protein